MTIILKQKSSISTTNIYDMTEMSHCGEIWFSNLHSHLTKNFRAPRFYVANWEYEIFGYKLWITPCFIILIYIYIANLVYKKLLNTQILSIRFANDNHCYWTHVLDFSSHGNTQANKNNLYWSNKVNNNMRCKVEKSRKGSLLSV